MRIYAVLALGLSLLSPSSGTTLVHQDASANASAVHISTPNSKNQLGGDSKSFQRPLDLASGLPALGSVGMLAGGLLFGWMRLRTQPAAKK